MAWGPVLCPSGPGRDPRAAATDGSVDEGGAPVVQKQMPAAANRLVLLSIPRDPRPLLWESSYRCGADEFGYITTSTPPALSLLVQQGGQDDLKLQQKLANLNASCGATTPIAPLKTALQLGDDVIDASWPQSVTVACF